MAYLVRTILLFAFVSAALPQALQQTPPPVGVLYHGLFMRYYGQEQFALHVDSEHRTGQDGKPINGDAVRAQLRTRIGLTVAEDATVKATALDYVAGFLVYTKARGQLLQSIPSDSHPANSPVVAQLTTLRQQHEAALTSHIAQIQSVMGARFSVLDAYVHNTVSTQIKFQTGSIKQ